MKLTLRDLFWLTLVVAMGCAWWLHYQRTNKVVRGLEQKLATTKSGAADMRRLAMGLWEGYKELRDATSARGLYLDHKQNPPSLIEVGGRPFERPKKNSNR